MSGPRYATVSAADHGQPDLFEINPGKRFIVRPLRGGGRGAYGVCHA